MAINVDGLGQPAAGRGPGRAAPQRLGPPPRPGGCRYSANRAISPLIKSCGPTCGMSAHRRRHVHDRIRPSAHRASNRRRRVTSRFHPAAVGRGCPDVLSGGRRRPDQLDPDGARPARAMSRTVAAREASFRSWRSAMQPRQGASARDRPTERLSAGSGSGTRTAQNVDESDRGGGPAPSCATWPWSHRCQAIDPPSTV